MCQTKSILSFSMYRIKLAIIWNIQITLTIWETLPDSLQIWFTDCYQCLVSSMKQLYFQSSILWSMWTFLDHAKRYNQSSSDAGNRGLRRTQSEGINFKKKVLTVLQGTDMYFFTMANFEYSKSAVVNFFLTCPICSLLSAEWNIRTLLHCQDFLLRLYPHFAYTLRDPEPTLIKLVRVTTV